MRRRCRCISTCISTCNADLTRPDLTRPDPSFHLTYARENTAFHLLGTDRARRAGRTADLSLLLVERGKPRRLHDAARRRDTTPKQPLPRTRTHEEPNE